MKKQLDKIAAAGGEAGEKQDPAVSEKTDRIKILYATSELAPYAYTGGLGDVSASLPPCLDRLGAEIRVVMPCYRGIRERFGDRLHSAAQFTVSLSWRRQDCEILEAEMDGYILYLVRCDYYYGRGALYGYYDDAERFAFFSLALLEMMEQVRFFPDVLHTGDWQCAAAQVYLECRFRGSRAGYENIRGVHTIHNIEYQGRFSEGTLGDILGLEDASELLLDGGGINLTRGAVLCADAVTTVSRGSLDDMLAPGGGAGLGGLLRENRGKLFGITNGIDEELFDPSTDIVLPCRYSAADMGGKMCCKAELQRLLGLGDRLDVPLFAVVSRLTEQKGVGLLLSILPELVERDIQIAVHGTGDGEYELDLRDASRRFPGKIASVLRFDPELAHLIYAGADAFIMPSRSEQCGLSQMIASRYGTVPIVHSVGGLRETVRDYDAETGEGDGFAFDGFSGEALLGAVARAERLFRRDRSAFTALGQRIMLRNFSWRSSGEKYMQLYRMVHGEAKTVRNEKTKTVFNF